ncbi:MAG TPA: trypsin-like peptidase domain-containing protein [Chitinophagaceae bacterium]|nr:trypsin-like peptidase domain-containing protein [Chitinophagaceae bacterium]
MALLTQIEVINLVDALISSGIDTGANRGALMQFIDPHYVALLPSGNLPAAQLLQDIGRMNQVERLANGDVPLQIYLLNATVLLGGSPQQLEVVKSTLNLVIQRATGAPRIDTDPEKIPETKEAIVHTDDTVTFAFMENGTKAALAVMKLRVPAFENGQPRKLQNGVQAVAQGTGWLLTGSLVMTNHHVIKARKEGEPAASDADLRMQAENTKGILDFDDDQLEGTQIAATGLEAWDKQLDYAIIRVPATGRQPLSRAANAIRFSTDPIPVNIIQHPGGRGKRYGIRNNLVSASTDKELRYFTDTETGSSGAPVLNDQWEVVALHRASTYISNVQFQGKSTAYVNIGTHLTAIIADINQRFPALAAEIGL